MTQRICIFAAALLVLLAMGWWWFQRDAAHDSAVSAAPARNSAEVERWPAADSAVGKTADAADSKTPPSTDPVATVPVIKSPEDTKFQQWIDRQAVEINRSKVDVAKTTKEIQQAIADLTASQMRQLVQVARDVSASSGSRIFSVYLLAEAGSKAADEVAGFLKDPVHSFGESTPHSEAEVKNGQERALRLMAIDGLAARARSDASALAALESAVPSIRDPYIQAYAKRKLNEVRRKR